MTEWGALGLEPMEDPALSLTSGDDSGGLGTTESEVDMSSEEGSAEALPWLLMCRHLRAWHQRWNTVTLSHIWPSPGI